jgi:Arc/MetJ-type ribon-helix-helix transcriptional regulator
MVQRTRPRITVTVDPDMLREVDTYIQEHEGTDRSRIVDEGLRYWYAQILHEALIRQHTAPQSPEEQEERAAWRRIRAAQFPNLLRKYEQHEEG